MSEWLAGVKVSVFGATLIGTVMSFRFIKMSWQQKITAIPSSLFLAHIISEPVSRWTTLSEGAAGAAIGLFGMAILKLVFDSLQNSDVSVKFNDIVQAIVQLFRRG